MNTGTFLRGAAALIVLTVTTPGIAVPVAIDTTSASNGVTDLYSATFDAPLEACTGGSPSYCSFFIGGEPGPGRNIVITPSPSGVINAVPLGFASAPASGSFLNLTLNNTNTQLTIAGGTIAFSPLVLTIQTNTVVNAPGGGVVFDPAPRTTAVDANGRAEFLINASPATIVDFSTFSTIVSPPNGSCAGPLCALIPVLTLDMIRYRLLIDYDPTFTSFTGSFIGQTGNNSILYITMNSGIPEIAVTDSVAPAADLQVPFGDVTAATSASQTVTVKNEGTGNLLLGAVALSNPLAAPFALANDTCTAATVLPTATCTFDVTFSPGSAGSFNDSLDIPSNDADEASITVAVSGNGTAQPVPNISVTDSVAPTTDQAVPFGSAGVGATLNQTVTVTNAGNANLVLGTITGLAAPFNVVTDNCSGQTVAFDAHCTLAVRFQPTGTGLFSDTFNIPSNDASDPIIIVAVSGTGTSLATPDISVTDNTLPASDLLVPFGNVTEGTTRDRTITVTNSGGLDLMLGTITGLDAPFSVVTDGCSSQVLAPAGNCNLLVRYAPPATGAASDSLTIPSDDPDEASVSVSLTGAGIIEGEGGTETPKPEGADGGFMAMDPATLLLLGAAGALGLRRRRSGIQLS